MADTFTVKDMELYYGSFHALKNVNLEYRVERDHRVYRPLRLRQIHAPQDA